MNDILNEAMDALTDHELDHIGYTGLIRDMVDEIERLRSMIRKDTILISEKKSIMEAKIKEQEQCIIALGLIIGRAEVIIATLEEAFIESEAENQFHQNYGESSWENHGDEDFEGHWGRNRFRREARGELIKILSGVLS